MKKGITITQRFELENVTSVDNLTDAIFTYKENENEGSKDADYLLVKKLSNDDVTFDDELKKFVIPLSQADTSKLTRIYYIEAQLIYTSGATNKWNIARKSLRPTLRTENVNGQSDGSEVEDLRMTIDDVFANGGGTTSDYNELENKPKINNVTLSGNKTTSDLGLEITTGDGLKREGNVVSADLDDNSILEFNNHKLSADTSGLQPTISGGNGIDISNNVVSVDLSSDQSQLLKFLNGQLILQPYDIAYNDDIRTELANSSIPNSLASKSYVDNLITTSLKYEVVQTLPTEDIDTHTIYLVPKSTSETNNIYDEYMYINNTWELIGSTEVDLSNYYTKTESDNKYQLIIDSSHKVSADYIDDRTSTNKFVRIIKSTDTPPSSSDTEYEVGTIWQKFSNSSFGLKTLTNVYVCKGHGTFVFTPIQYQWEDITDHYSKSETDTLLNDKPNVFSGGGKPTDVKADYPNVKVGDYYIDLRVADNPTVLWVCIAIELTTVSWRPTDNKIFFGYSAPFSNYTDLANATNLSYISVGSIYIKNNDGAYVLTDNTSATWVWSKIATQTDLSSKQDTIDSTHKLSADLVTDTSATNKFVPTSSSADNGKFLRVVNGVATWQTVPQAESNSF